MLDEIGDHLLIVAVKGDATLPQEHRGRRLLLAMPCTMERLNDAYRVTTGHARAVKSRTAQAR